MVLVMLKVSGDAGWYKCKGVWMDSYQFDVVVNGGKRREGECLQLPRSANAAVESLRISLPIWSLPSQTVIYVTSHKSPPPLRGLALGAGGGCGGEAGRLGGSPGPT